MDFKDSDLKCEVVHPIPRGGQHVGTIGTEVKVTHIPTGWVVVVDSGRSQGMSRRLAASMIEWGLLHI